MSVRRCKFIPSDAQTRLAPRDIPEMILREGGGVAVNSARTLVKRKLPAEPWHLHNTRGKEKAHNEQKISILWVEIQPKRKHAPGTGTRSRGYRFQFLLWTSAIRSLGGG